MDNQVRNDIKALLAKRGRTLTSVVQEMNSRHPNNKTTIQNVSNKLSRGTIKYSEVIEIAEIVGCQITWKKSDASG